MSKRPQTATKKNSAPPTITDETIAARAYQKWHQRGCPLWDQEHDWFTARIELEQELAPDHAGSFAPAAR